MEGNKLYSERTTVRAIAVTGILCGLGALLLVTSANVGWFSQHGWAKSVMDSVGGSLIASAALAGIWELIAKRAFMAELLAKARLAHEVRDHGLSTLSLDFNKGVDWAHLIKTSTSLDIFFTYGYTWRALYANELSALIQRSMRIRVCLPDWEDPVIVSELARRFESSPDDVVRSVKEAEAFFRRAFEPLPAIPGRELSIWRFREVPSYSFYRFDHYAVLTFYRHRKGKGGVPALLVERGGRIYDDFVLPEAEAFFDPNRNHAKRVYPEAPARTAAA